MPLYSFSLSSSHRSQLWDRSQVYANKQLIFSEIVSAGFRNRENLDWEPVRSRSQLCPMKSGKSSVPLVRMLNSKRDRIMNILIINRANDPSMNLIERSVYSFRHCRSLPNFPVQQRGEGENCTVYYNVLSFSH